MSHRIEKPFLIFVEGKDDVAVIELLVSHLNIADSVQVISADGKDKLRKFIRTFVALEGFPERVQGVAIIRDADTDPGAARTSAEDSLNGIENARVYLLPDDSGPGILEDLCLQTLQDRPDLQCVDTFMECMGATGITLSNPPKFRMRALLTALDDGKTRDTFWAAEKRLLNPTHPAFHPLLNFLKSFTS